MISRLVRNALKGSSLLRSVGLAVREEVAFRKLTSTSTPLGFRFAGNASMEDGTYEPEEVAFLQEALGTCDLFVDVGANVGFHACLARAKGVSTIAIEPHPSNVRRLLFNLRSNGWEDVEVFPVGAGARPGIVTIHGTGTSASFIEGWAGDLGEYSLTVPVSTLDALVAERVGRTRTVIKVDVEGFEAETLKGASRVLASEPAPTWLVEVVLTQHVPGGLNTRFEEVFAQFWRSGYRARTIAGQHLTPQIVARWSKERKADSAACSYVFDKPTSQ